VDQGDGESRAGGAERVADGDGAAVDVVLLLVDSEFAAGVLTLGGERLVELDEVVVVDGPTGAVKQAAVAGTGPIPITVGSTPATLFVPTSASTSSPWSSANLLVVTSVSDAPSEICEEFPAVTVPSP